jgi:hypothetical protein
MGLEGTLRDFSVRDVFQVLGLQKKTGILTIDGPNDTITVSVLAGEIIAADSTARSLEDRLGNLLVLSEKLSSEGLAAALESKSKTREPLAMLLAREELVSPEDLGEATRLEVLRIVRSAFGWTEGKFRFRQQVVSAHNGALPSPIPTEQLLRDTARELEEWPKLQRKIASPNGVYRRVSGLENLRLSTPSAQSGEGILPGSRHEVETWKWVNGQRRVGEILERAFLSEFDTYRGLAALLDRDLIAQVGVAFAIEAPPRPRRFPISARSIGLWALLLVLLTSAIRQVPRHPWNLFLRPAGEFREVSDLFKAVSFARLAALERAVRVFYDSTGRYPKSLEDLLSSGVLTAEGAIDPWGRQYRYILRPAEGKFALYGRNAQGEIDLALSFERSLAPVSESHPAVEAPRRDRKPGVQVIK